MSDSVQNDLLTQVTSDVPLRAAVQSKRLKGANLSLTGISLSFGGVTALDNISFKATAGEILSIIGPNGAGKSSLLNVISGLYRAKQGAITLDGKRYRFISPQKLAKSGVARSFQNLALFSGLSVAENILQGLAFRVRQPLLTYILGFPAARREGEAQMLRAREMIDFFDLGEVADQPVSTLSYGLQKKVEMARALVGEPRLLLLDEPMAGMTLGDKQQLAKIIRQIRDHFGTTILLIEHDVGIVMGLSDSIVVLEYGRKIAEGTPEHIRQDPAVIAAYLGTTAPQLTPAESAS